jgi:broad specificity phosphatase PhoE
MPRLYLVRHGEPSGTWGQHPDPGLSDLGHRQAGVAARALAGLGVEAVLVSPLMRCRETAAPFVAASGLAPQIEPRVAEIAAPPGPPGSARDWLMALLAGSWSGEGAGLAGWRSGVGDALRACTRDTAVFSHFVAINAAVSVAAGSDLVTVFRPGHASITVLETDGDGLRLVALGDEDAVRLT